MRTEWQDGDRAPRYDCPCRYCIICRSGGCCDGGTCAFDPCRDSDPNIEAYRKELASSGFLKQEGSASALKIAALQAKVAQQAAEIKSLQRTVNNVSGGAAQGLLVHGKVGMSETIAEQAATIEHVKRDLKLMIDEAEHFKDSAGFYVPEYRVLQTIAALSKQEPQ